jgi:hypothetical protein
MVSANDKTSPKPSQHFVGYTSDRAEDRWTHVLPDLSYLFKLLKVFPTA